MEEAGFSMEKGKEKEINEASASEKGLKKAAGRKGSGEMRTEREAGKSGGERSRGIEEPAKRRDATRGSSSLRALSSSSSSFVPLVFPPFSLSSER